MDSSIPPSYEEANTRDYWSIIAQYIKSADLCAASLVSRRWHQIFAPCLWGNPASHFGTENDRVYGSRKYTSLLHLSLIHPSRSHSFQASTPDSACRSTATHSYPTSASSTVRTIRWPSFGVASRYPGAAPEPSVTSRISASLFRSFGTPCVTSSQHSP